MRLIGLLVCATGLASAQAIIEHAIAAGAGSVTGVAGKGLSDSVNKILGKSRALVESLEQASGPVVPKIAPSPAGNRIPAPLTSIPVPMAPLPGVPASIPPAAGQPLPPAPGQQVAAYYYRPVVPKKAKGKVASWELMPQTEAVESELERSTPTSEEIAKVTNGTTREQLLAALGKPSSRVMLHSDGGLLEIYSYVSPSGNSGSIRLTDGAVSSVHPSASSR